MFKEKIEQQRVANSPLAENGGDNLPLLDGAQIEVGADPQTPLVDATAFSPPQMEKRQSNWSDIEEEHQRMQAVQEQLEKDIAARDRTIEALRNELAGKETERNAEREKLRQLGQCVIALQAGKCSLDAQFVEEAKSSKQQMAAYRNDFPILFQFARGASVGVLQNRNFMTNFEGAVLNNCLPSQKYFDGVIKMFKEKINALFGIDERIKTSLQHNFHTKLGPSSENRSTSAGSSSSELRRQRNASSGCRCPTNTLSSRLAFRWFSGSQWPPFGLTLTNLYWSRRRISRTSTRKVPSVGNVRFNLTTNSVLNRLLPSSDSSSCLGTTALGPLISKPMVRNINFVEESPLNSESDLSDCVSFILKESLNDNEGPKAEEQFTEAQQRMFVRFSSFFCLCRSKIHLILQKFSNLNSVPSNSFIRRLAVCLIEKIDGNFVDFCRLWTKFLQILRHHWEYNLNLPNFDTDERPQLSCCLLHQKLQMINFCISVKKRKHKEMEANETENLGGTAKDLQQIETLRQRESFLYNLEDANLRTKAQSELLLSDMQAFKAPNPCCELVDFLRWHSPRDLT
ncbi:hypothetical protein niasHS_015535 [Heterodera schachtii]|uniref:Rab3 GTPase-activating protein catalytic subunit n=1 Tax=Heterodera schachtii TaxID=97005 RepID=A0ABD2HQB5_HETSC